MWGRSKVFWPSAHTNGATGHGTETLATLAGCGHSREKSFYLPVMEILQGMRDMLHETKEKGKGEMKRIAI
jgi:hypothetical protein